MGKILHLVCSLPSVLRRLSSALSEFIEDFVAGIPETLSQMSEGYSCSQHVDPLRRHEKLLRRFLANDIRLFGKNCRYRIHNLLLIARFYREHGLFMQSAGQFDEAMRIVRLLDKDERRIAELLELGDFYASYARFEAARECFGYGLELADDSEKVLDLRRRLALVMASEGNFAGAAEQYRLMVDLLLFEDGPSSEGLHLPLRELVSMLKQSGKESEAAYFEKLLLLVFSVQIIESRDEDSYYLRSDLTALAQHLRLGGKLEIALALEERAEFIALYHKVKSESLPKMRDVEKVCDWLNKRAKGGDKSVAFRLHRHALQMHEKAKEAAARKR